MLKQTLSTMASMSLLLSFTPAIALDVEEETTKKDSSKFIFANAGSKYLHSSMGSRYIYGATAGIDYPINDGKVYLKTNISKQEVRMKFKKKTDEYYTTDHPRYKNLPAENEFKLKQSNATIEEAFFEKSFGNASITAGRSKIVFSDSVGVTPFSYLAPKKTLSSGFEGAKLDSLIAQDNVQLAYNFGGNTEIRGYYIKGANIDSFEKSSRQENSASWKYKTKSGSENNTFENITKKVNDKVDGSKAITITHYPGWGRIKILYSQGYDMNLLQDSSVVKKESDFSYDSKTYETWNVNGEYTLAKAKAYGFAVDWKYNKMDMGIEVIQVDTRQGMDVNPYQKDKSVSEKSNHQKYLEYLISDNGGSNQFNVKFSMLALKAGKQFGKWSVYGSIMAMKMNQSDKYKKANELRRAIHGLSTKEQSVFVLGGTVAKYTIDDDKNIDLFGGLMPGFAGLGTNYNQQVNDNLSFSISGLAGKFLKDGALEDVLAGEAYKKEDKITPFIGFTVNYKL